MNDQNTTFNPFGVWSKKKWQTAFQDKNKKQKKLGRAIS